MIKNILKNKQELLFYISFFLVSLAQTFGIGADDNPIVVLITIASFIVYIFKVFGESYTKKELLLIIILTIYAGISYLYSHNLLVVINVFVIIAMKNIDIKKLIKCLFVYRLIGFLMVISLTLIGVLPNSEKYLFVNGVNTFVIRQSLGFFHPNLLALYFFVLISMVIYGCFEKIRCPHYILLVILTIVIYNICYSRSGLLCTLFLITVSFAIKYFKKIHKLILNRITYILPIILALVFVLISMFYIDNFILEKINSLLSGRLYLSNVFIENYGLSFFGIMMENTYYIDSSRVIIDSGYVHYLLNYGILGFTLLMYVMYLCSKYFLKNNKLLEFVIFTSFSLYCMTEKELLICLLNFPLLYVSKYLFSSKKYG